MDFADLLLEPGATNVGLPAASAIGLGGEFSRGAHCGGTQDPFERRGHIDGGIGNGARDVAGAVGAKVLECS